MCVSVCKNTLFEVYEIHPINMMQKCAVNLCRNMGSFPALPGERVQVIFSLCIRMFCLPVVMIMLHTVLNVSPHICLYDPNLNSHDKYL